MNVLLIDDDLISRLALVESLRPLPHLTLVEAQSGDQAWERLQSGWHPALCCCDVRMPGMSGMDLLQRMREDPRLKAVPVLMVSSASDRQTVTVGIQLGIGGFIVKPFLAAELRAKVRALLGTNLETAFEPRNDVMKRLNITSARYTAYMEALAQQMDTKAQAWRDAAPTRPDDLDTLHTGCLTLGAHYAAGVVAGMKQRLGSAPLGDLLDELPACARVLRDRAAMAYLKWQ